MKTSSATYKGARGVELFEALDLPKDTAVVVIIPEQEHERELRSQLRGAAEVVFAKLWDNAVAALLKYGH